MRNPLKASEEIITAFKADETKQAQETLPLAKIYFWYMPNKIKINNIQYLLGGNPNEKIFFSALVSLMLIAGVAYGATITVPGDYSTIQAAINAASNGDTVLVADGTYNEHDLDFNGKAITVRSENGAASTIIDCENNGRGFHFQNGESSSSVVQGFTIKRGYVDGPGGGIRCYNSSPTITGNIIKDNVGAGEGGGGINCNTNAAPIITNNLIISNSAISSSGGGGIYCRSSSTPQIINNTIANNSAEGGGGGFYCSDGGNPTVKNCIVWGNAPQQIIIAGGGGITVTYSDVQGGYSGTGNINSDPLFGNPYSGLDYDLKPGSPCLNTGTSTDAPSTDIVGRSRPNPTGSNPDMGAYEQNADASLAVELSLFTASVITDGVTLKWRTETEINNVGFSIYRSEEKDDNYTRIAFISGAGNSAMPNDYQFTDKKVEQGKTYFYYLEDIDVAGERSKSKIIKVIIPPAIPATLVQSKFELFQNFPNPFNPETWLPYQLAESVPVTIRIFDLRGRIIRTLDFGNQQAGGYVTKDKAAYWNGRNDCGEHVSSGLYFYQLKAGEFSAIRKMVIMK